MKPLPPPAPVPPPEPPAAALEGPTALEADPVELPPLTAEEEAAANARSAALRAGLPVPVEAWKWERDLVFDGFRLGTVTIEAEPASLADKPVWLVQERTVREAGEGRVVSESSCFLAPDLSLIRGETVLRAPGGTESFFFGRRDGKFEVTAQSGTEEKTVEVDAPEDATLGLFPVIRLLEAAFARNAETALPLRLPGFDPRNAFGDGEGKPVPAGRADVSLELAPSVVGQGYVPKVGLIKVVARTPAGRSSTLYLGQDLAQRERTVGSVRGTFPSWNLGPANPARKRPDWFDRVGATPQTAYQAFCNFGRGYHLAKRELLEQAFHWPSMREHEIAAGNYAADVTVEKVKEDYIAEFLRMSKHRTAGDCDDLLTQILVTAKITKQPDGSVMIAAIPVYGGHVFHCELKDRRWWVTKLD